MRSMRARVSDCTRSTAASAVRPVATASRRRVQPAAVVGEHAVGFEHVAVLAAVGDVAALDSRSRSARSGLDGGVEPVQLVLHVVGDEVGDDDARLVQHDVAERDAVVEATMPVRCIARLRGGFGAGPGEATTARRRRSSRRSPSRWSAAPLLPPPSRCAARGSARPARRACCRRAGPARRGRSDRSPRRFPAGRRRPGAPARPRD